jgi:hypothetical protein
MELEIKTLKEKLAKEQEEHDEEQDRQANLIDELYLSNASRSKEILSLYKELDEYMSIYNEENVGPAKLKNLNKKLTNKIKSFSTERTTIIRKNTSLKNVIIASEKLIDVRGRKNEKLTKDNTMLVDRYYELSKIIEDNVEERKEVDTNLADALKEIVALKKVNAITAAKNFQLRQTKNTNSCTTC